MQKPFGEVLSSSISRLTASCWQEQEGGRQDAPPAVPRFGSFLEVQSSEHELVIFAVVEDVITGPRDNLHKPVPLGLSRQELKAKQPQIFSLLQTEIHAATIGYKHRRQYHCGLPPYPAQVHDFVCSACEADVIAVTEDLDFIRFLSLAAGPPNDELVVAAINCAYAARNNDYRFLVDCGRALASACGDDYNRLSSSLKRLNSKTAISK